MRRQWSGFMGLAMGAVVLCLWLSQTAHAESKTVLVLVDLSSSTTQHRADYLKYFNMIMAKINGGDVLLVTRIVKDPSGESTVEVSQEFPVFSMFRDSEIKYKRKMREMKEDISSRVKRLLESQSKETPILDTLLQSERLFKTFTRDKKVIVVMSDMVEQSKSYDFLKLSLTDKVIEQVAGTLKKEGKIPNLHDAVVYVAGARTRDVDKKNQIESFWLHYFQDCGAVGSRDRYGAELLKFEE